jgi:ATP-dependent DNA ligase
LARCGFYAFDILALDGDDLRRLPLSRRKRKLSRLLKLWPNGIFVAPFEQGEIGPDLFRAACNMGLEGMVSKRADRPYRAPGCSTQDAAEDRPVNQGRPCGLYNRVEQGG